MANSRPDPPRGARAVRCILLLAGVFFFVVYATFNPVFITKVVSSDGQIGAKTRLTLEVLRTAGAINGMAAFAAFAWSVRRRKVSPPSVRSVAWCLAGVYTFLLVPFCVISVVLLWR